MFYKICLIHISTNLDTQANWEIVPSTMRNGKDGD